MAIQAPPRPLERAREVQPRPSELTTRPSRLLTIVAILAIVIGSGSILGGLAGATYTYQQAAAEGVVTPPDARIPEAEVRGPITMWAQSDIITQHQLDSTDGLRYAEMEREVPAVDENGDPVLDESGEQVMVPNEARQSWVTATSLTTALGLGILAYGVSALAAAVGVALLGMGLVLLRIRKAVPALA